MKHNEITNRFYYARRNAGLSAVDVTQKSLFLTKQAISNYETGKSLPSNKVLFEFHDFYNVSIDYLLCNDSFQNHEDFVLNTLLITKETLDTLIILKKKNIKLTDLKLFLQKLGDKDKCL